MPDNIKKEISQNLVSVNDEEINESEEAPGPEVKRLELREDYYAMTWCGFQKQYQKKYKLTIKD